MDYVNRRLYYTNTGSQTVEDKEYSWHKIETVQVDSTVTKVRTIVSNADRPRALTVDATSG